MMAKGKGKGAAHFRAERDRLEVNADKQRRRAERKQLLWLLPTSLGEPAVDVAASTVLSVGNPNTGDFELGCW